MFESLKVRSTQEELMDDFSCHGEIVHQTLRELHLINTYLGGNHISLNATRRLINSKKKDSYRIADLGCGGGDTLVMVARDGLKKGFNLDLVGVDANENITAYAEKNCADFGNISFLTQDIFSDNFKSQKFDIAHCSLFLHHFKKDQIVDLLSQLYDQVELGIIINDLHRHWISYYFTKYLITSWSKSEMVKFDSVVSVARSFTRKELEKYLELAAITNYSLKWKWAFRWELVIYK